MALTAYKVWQADNLDHPTEEAGIERRPVSRRYFRTRRLANSYRKFNARVAVHGASGPLDVGFRNETSRELTRIVSALVQERVGGILARRVVATLSACMPIGAMRPHTYYDVQEDEYSLFWVAAGKRIEISIPAVGPIYVNTDQICDFPAIDGFFRIAPASELRRRIAALTKIVEAARPNEHH